MPSLDNFIEIYWLAVTATRSGLRGVGLFQVRGSRFDFNYKHNELIHFKNINEMSPRILLEISIA